jgi:peptidyl-prolyl cis-trans isomerase A (cyclophilin A)
MSASVSALIRLFLCLLLLAPGPALAGTVVRVSTALGDFDIELQDETAPITVANFLQYVNRGAYNGTVVHRLVPGFVIQGGWLSFNEAQQTLYPLVSSGNIKNEFSAASPNLRGTIAMAKVAGNPDSANSQWFINLRDNPVLNTTEGGYTVFGRVLGSGMQLVDRIAALPPVTVLAGYDPFPLIDYAGGTLLNRHMVSLNMRVLGSTSGHPIVFDGATATLHARINAGELGLIQGAFKLVRETPAIEIQLDATSVFTLGQSVAGMGSFDSATGRLTLPELRINGAVAYRNVRFLLVDAQQLLFRLEGAQ